MTAAVILFYLPLLPLKALDQFQCTLKKLQFNIKFLSVLHFTSVNQNYFLKFLMWKSEKWSIKVHLQIQCMQILDQEECFKSVFY